jgi:5'-3' exonuclease
MNQQRSRRFRSVQEAREKYEARLEAEAEWKGASYFLTRPEKMLTSCFSNGQGNYFGN